MKISFVFFFSDKLIHLTALFKRFEEGFNEFHKGYNYGGDVNKLYLGLVCVEPNFKQFIKIKKPKFIDEDNEKSVEYDVEFEHEKFSRLGANEFLKSGLDIVCNTTDPILQFCLRRGFNLAKLQMDMKIFFEKFDALGSHDELTLNDDSLLQNKLSFDDNNSPLYKEKLKVFFNKEKFQSDIALNYPDLTNSETKKKLSEFINNSVQYIIDLNEAEISEFDFHSFLIDRLKKLDAQNLVLDSEDQDRVGIYFEEIMDALSIESSEGILNRWRYGFDPQQPNDLF